MTDIAEFNKEEESRVIEAMREANYMPLTPYDMIMIRHNILNAYGINPSNEEIRQEVEAYYNN